MKMVLYILGEIQLMDEVRHQQGHDLSKYLHCGKTWLLLKMMDLLYIDEELMLMLMKTHIECEQHLRKHTIYML
jgi:hypothetical protein